MFAITIRERSGQVYTFHFDKPEVCIGRVKGNDVILPKQNISKRHTLIKVHGSRFVVEDQGSTNGTYVNGHRIASAVEIGPEDKVYLGDFVMNFADLSGQAHIEPPAPPAPGAEAEAGESALQASSFVGKDEATNIRATQHMDNLPGLEEILAAAAASEAAEAAAAAGSYISGSNDLPDLPSDQGDLAGWPSPEADLPPLPDDLAGLEALLGGDAGLSPIEALDVPSEIMPLRPIPDSLDGNTPGLELEERLTGPIVGLQQALERSSALNAIPGLSAAIKPAPERATERPGSGGHTASLLAAQSGLHAAVDTEAGPGTLDPAALLFRDAMRELRASVPADPGQMTEQDWADLEQQVLAFVERRQAAGQLLNAPADQVARDLIYELAGYGPLEPMLDDAQIDTIEVLGHEQIFVVRRGAREAVPQRFSCQQALMLTVDRLARAAGHPTTKGYTTLEATMDDGTQVQVVWPPLSPQGLIVTLRKPRGECPDLDTLVARGWLAPEVAATLRSLVQQGRSIAIVGVPDNGRRTLQNALAHLMGASQRLVVVEDGQRLKLEQPHVVRLDAAAFVAPDAPSPLALGLRLRPDWLLFTESDRVAPATLLDITADDRASWIGTFIGRDAQDFCSRLEHSLLLAYPGLDPWVAKIRVHRSIDIIAAFEEAEPGRRELRLYARPRWDTNYWAMNLP
jgi:pilus assembly protein CpaF